MNQYQIQLQPDEKVKAGEIPMLIAEALHPLANGDENDPVWFRQAVDNNHLRRTTVAAHLELIHKAIENNSLLVNNFITGAPGNHDVWVLQNIVNSENLSDYVRKFDIEVSISKSIDEASSTKSIPQPEPASEPVKPAAVLLVLRERGAEESKTHRIKSREPAILSAEIDQAKSTAPDSNSATSIWGELTKLSETKFGVLVGFSSDGVQYRGKKHQSTEEPDVFTLKNLRDRIDRTRKAVQKRA